MMECPSTASATNLWLRSPVGSPQAWKELVGIKFTVPSVLSLRRPQGQEKGDTKTPMTSDRSLD
jgi:hypothetical protein